MTDHTTHFDDCGCAAEQHLAEVRKIAAERDALAKDWAASRLEVAKLRAEVARLRSAAQLALDYVEMDEHTHGRDFRAGIALRAALYGMDEEPPLVQLPDPPSWENLSAEAGDGNREA